MDPSMTLFDRLILYYGTFAVVQKKTQIYYEDKLHDNFDQRIINKKLVFLAQYLE